MLGAALAVLAIGCSTGPGPNTANPQVSGQDATYVNVVQAVSPSVVEIQTGSGLGSGVVYDNKGDVVTNAHVVGQEQRLLVITSDGKRLEASLVGSYPPDDLAVIKVSGGNLKPARWADSAKATVGQLVLAIGSPLGLQSSVTQGIVSATNRVVGEGGGIVLPDAIQTSAAINPGNSGGALVDMQEQVLGIPTLAALIPDTGGAPAPGIGFAIASNRATELAGQIVEYGHVVNTHRAYLGVQTVPTTAGGVLVVGLDAGGPADRAGIQTGDLIVSVAGTATPTPGDLQKVLATKAPGDTVDVTVVRSDGHRMTLKATLGQLPGS